MAHDVILVIDDEDNIRESLTGVFEDEGYIVLAASSGEEGVKLFDERLPDAVFLDVWLPTIDGIETLRRIRAIDATVPVVIISGHGNIELAVSATKTGAYDFLEKPLSLDKLLIVARRALDHRRLEIENRSLRSDLKGKIRLVGNSDRMVLLRQQIDMAAQGTSRVLILGESGTGKELVARQLHEKSSRSKGPFIEVNCAAIPQELIESELFGHEKGAFTGAADRKTGKFELAHGGTLFLDEVGDMTLQTQAKVLRVIETQIFQRVGGGRDIKVDVWIIAATNKDLPEEVRKGTFREDLYFRLNVIPLTVPPLRERKGDIPLLVQHLCERFANENGIRQKEIAPDVIMMFQEFDWPGNIRELKNTVERLMIMVPANAVTKTDAAALGVPGPFGIQEGSDYFSQPTLKNARDAFERDYIIRKLAENDWNISRTASLIDIERSNLHKKIKAYGIREPFSK